MTQLAQAGAYLRNSESCITQGQEVEGADGPARWSKCECQVWSLGHSPQAQGKHSDLYSFLGLPEISLR